MAHNLVDHLRSIGWTYADFNHNGPQPPYVRIAMSYLRWETIVQPMSSGKPIWGRSKSPSIRSIIANRYIRILKEPYAEIADGQWIEGQSEYPFDAWVWPRSFYVTGAVVAAKDGRTFHVGYGAFSMARGVELQV